MIFALAKPPMVPSAKERIDAAYEAWNISDDPSDPDIETRHEWAMEQAYDDGFAAACALIASERDARCKCEDALRRKDEAMSVLFERLHAAGVNCSDLIP